jgi:RNA polymerase sigma-70 factor (ECF subfamily)
VALVSGQPSVTRASEDQRCVRAFNEDRDYVWRTLARHGVPRADIEDLAQEVFLVMWRRWHEYDAARPLRPWLAGIASNVARSHLRRSGRETLRGLIERPSPELSGEDRLAGRRVAKVVAGALADLPERHRELLVLHDLEGVPVREIAERLGVPVFTIYTRLRRARGAMAKGLRRSRAVLPSSPSATRRRIIAGCAAAGVAALVLLVLLARLFSPPRAPVAHPLRGMIGYWRFDERPGSTAARDLSAGANPCALRGLDPGRVWTAGVLGGAIALTGQGWLECSRPEPFAALGEELTISVWVKASPAPGLRTLVSRQLGDGRLDRFYLGIDGSREAVVFSSHLWKGVLRHPLPSHAWSRWFHLTAVHSAEGVSKLYLDGHEVMRRQTTRGPLGGGISPVLIGAANNGPPGSAADERFEGALDELMIYDRALSDGEVAALAAPAQPAATPPSIARRQ